MLEKGIPVFAVLSGNPNRRRDKVLARREF